MDVLIRSPFPATAADPSFLRARTFWPTKVSIQPPPPGFDFWETFLPGSRDTIPRTHPELLDLAEDGTLLLVEKRQFGPVPACGMEFVEPQEIWLMGTSHTSEDSAGNVERGGCCQGSFPGQCICRALSEQVHSSTPASGCFLAENFYQY